VTGTLTNAVARAVTRLRGIATPQPRAALPGQTWAVYLGGALAGAAAERAWRAQASAIPLGLVLLISSLAISRVVADRESTSATAG
jgi:uncharacterized membrane protein YoaK (UPF0700 family)